MPRQARLDYEGCLYHLINRGMEKKVIFKGPEDYLFFIKALGKALEEENHTCYGWVLMPNHFHLLVERNKKPLSRFMSRISTRYASYYNRKYKRAGKLFQNRYKAVLCDNEEYFLELVAYIHLNPLRANMVNSVEALEAYPWSGHRALLGKDKNTWQNADDVLVRFGRKQKRAREGYLAFLKERSQAKKDLSGGGLVRSAGGWEVVKDMKADEVERYDSRILGDGDFVKRIVDEEDREEVVQKLAYEQIKKRVMQELPLNEKELSKPGKSTKQGKQLRAILSYAAVRYGEEMIVDMAERFGITPAATGRLVLYGEEILENNQDLRRAILK